MSLARTLAVALLAMLLAGCAAQVAYREGRNLLERGDTIAGLAKLEEATRLDPRSSDYRLAFLQARERTVVQLLREADAASAKGKLDDADRTLRHALALDPTNERITLAVRRLETRKRHDDLLRQGEAAFARGDTATANTVVRTVMLEQPNHEAALALRKRIDAKAAARPRADGQLAASFRKPITIEFRDVPLRTVFEVISRTSGLNFVFDKEVRSDQKTTIFLRNSTVESAVQVVLLTNQLEQRVLNDQSILIYPSTPAKLKDYQTLVMRTFHLANADAKTLANTLKTLLKAKDVVPDERLNLIVMRDTPQAVRQAEKLVAIHDVPEPEVMLEVEILEVKRAKLFELGVRWPDQVTLSLLPTTSGGTLTLADLRNVSRSDVGAAVPSGSITARERDTDANILANPRIRARNREKAKILIGERVPNISTTATATGFISESVNYVDVGLKLDVEPTVYQDGEVVMKLALEVSNIVNQIQTRSGTLAYQIGTRTASTVLRVRDGENQVLAGLINDEDRRTANKVPGLGSVPIIGRLFGSHADDSSKTEIILSITPRVLRNVPRPEADEIEFESGTENSLGGGVSGGGAGGTSSMGVAPTAPTATPPRPSTTPAAPGAGSPMPSGSAAGMPLGGTAAPGDVAAAVPSITSGGAIAVGAASNASMRWVGTGKGRIGDTVNVQLALDSTTPVTSVPLVITFDPRLLQITTVNEGEFMRLGNARSTFESRVDPQGTITVTAAQQGDVGGTGSASLLSLSARIIAIGPATATLSVQGADPKTTGGRSLGLVLPAPFSITIDP